MFVDVCIPKGNEQEFAEIALKLGTKALLFLYGDKGPVQKPETILGLKIYYGSLSEKKPAFPTVFARGTQQNIESHIPKFLYGFESQEERDSFHYKRSGINQVIGPLLRQKNKTVVFDMEKILTSKNPEFLLGRMMQNLSLVRKYGVEIIICSFASKPENLRAGKEYESLLRSTGFQQEAKEAVNLLSEKLKE